MEEQVLAVDDALVAGPGLQRSIRRPSRAYRDRGRLFVGRLLRSIAPRAYGDNNKYRLLKYAATP